MFSYGLKRFSILVSVIFAWSSSPHHQSLLSGPNSVGGSSKYSSPRYFFKAMTFLCLCLQLSFLFHSLPVALGCDVRPVPAGSQRPGRRWPDGLCCLCLLPPSVYWTHKTHKGSVFQRGEEKGRMQGTAKSFVPEPERRGRTHVPRTLTHCRV